MTWFGAHHSHQNVAQMFRFVESLELLFEQEQIVVGPRHARRQRARHLELDSREHFQASLRRQQLGALFPQVRQFHKLFVAIYREKRI